VPDVPQNLPNVLELLYSGKVVGGHDGKVPYTLPAARQAPCHTPGVDFLHDGGCTAPDPHLGITCLEKLADLGGAFLVHEIACALKVDGNMFLQELGSQPGPCEER